MQVVELPGYAETEKREIATRYLCLGLLRLHGLMADQFEVTDEGGRAVIGGYTREGGRVPAGRGAGRSAPAAWFPERRETVAGELSDASPSTCGCRGRRCARTVGPLRSKR